MKQINAKQTQSITKNQHNVLQSITTQKTIFIMKKRLPNEDYLWDCQDYQLSYPHKTNAHMCKVWGF